MPLEHQTDRLSTADQKDFTLRYEALMRHYRMQGRKIQADRANENSRTATSSSGTSG